MKLVYLSESRIPSREANSVHVMKMCAAFAALGQDVMLLAPDTADVEPDVRDPYEFYGVERTFRMRKLPTLKARGRAWIYGLKAGRFARRGRFELAYGRNLHACAVASSLGIPTVWDAHMATFLRKRHERALFSWMIARSSFRGMTTNCGALRDAILAEVPSVAGRIVVAHNGADPVPSGTVGIDFGAAPGRLQVGYVGQLYPGKGVDMIRALAALLPWADFHVVGGNPDALSVLAADTGASPNLRVHGFVPPSRTQRYLLACDVLLAPYQRRVETAGGGETGAWMSPLKLFDYMAAGKPIICSDVPVLREIIADGRNGIMLPADDAGAWAAALHRLADDPAERARLGQGALADFRAQHTWLQRAERSLAIFSAAA